MYWRVNCLVRLTVSVQTESLNMGDRCLVWILEPFREMWISLKIISKLQTLALKVY